MIKRQMDTVTVFLNRSCPRKCVQCGVTKPENRKKELTIDEWINMFLLLKQELGVKFFLILGTEPLLFGYELIKLIEFFKRENLFYAFYSTSPEPLFSRYAQSLVDAGLTNWAAGIDTLPGKGWVDDITEKKAKESLEGLKWMGSKGLQTWCLITVHNKNLSHIPEIIQYCADNVPNVLLCINSIEWAHDNTFDFFSRKEEMPDLIIPDSRKDEVIDMLQTVLYMTRNQNIHLQNTDLGLIDWVNHYDKLDYVCNGLAGLALDCDGSLRKCGYSKGNLMPNYRIEDFLTEKEEILFNWYVDCYKCKGCHWSYITALQEGFETLVPNTPHYTDRWIYPVPRIREMLNTLK